LSSNTITVNVNGGNGQPPDGGNPVDVEDPDAPLRMGSTVGTLPGAPSVNPSGSVTYSIPIPVSPGSAGMQPSLSLSYNSQGGRSIVGTGWSLAGFSTIHRCPASVAIDGFKGRIDFGATDRFCLDGARLVSLGGPDGANGTEYRIERDSHSRIFSRVDGSNRTYWIVETKGGQTLRFETPLYWSKGNAASVDSSKVKAWGVTRVQDTVGNYMLFDYTVDHNRGWLLPSAIRYTGNDVSPTTAPYATVSIDYSYNTRLDTSVIYDGTGSYGQTPPLVTAITSRLATNDVAYRIKLEYSDSPTTGRTRLISAQLCGKGIDTSNGLCMTPTGFEYNDAKVHASSAWLLAEPQNIGFFLNAGRGKNMLALDKDGNGKTDILKSDFFVTATGQPELVLGDFNGDGISDVAYVAEVHTRDGSTNTARIYICLGQASGDIGACLETDYGAEENYESWYRWCNDGNTCLNLPKLTAADFDGDGKSDLALSNGKIYMGFGENAPRIRVAPELGAFGGGSIFPGNSYVGGDSIFADFDGDGRMDFAHCIRPVEAEYCNQNNFSRWKVYRSIITKTDAHLLDTPAFVFIETDGPRKAGNPQAHVADLNGDGLADLLADGQPGGNGAPDGGVQNDPTVALQNKYRWHGCLSRGDGTMDCSIWYGPRNYETDFDGNRYGIEVLGDFNGDGRTDLAVYDQASSLNNDTGGAWWICVSRPWVTASAAGGLFDCSPSRDGGEITALWGGGKWTGGIRRNAANGQLKYDQVAVGDFNGDGRTGLAGGTPVSPTGTNYPRIMRPNVSDPVANIPDMLASVTNGLGFKSSFKYKPITDNSIYTKGTGPGVYPKLNIQSPMYVATEVSHDNGLADGGQIRYTYKYEDLKGHTEGGGTLGFGKVIVKDEQSQIVTETTYDNDYPARGLVLSTVKKQANGQLLSRSSTTYKKVAPYKSSALTEKIHTYLTETTTDESWDLDGTPMPRTTTLTTYARLPDAQGDDILGNIDNNDERNRAFGCATNVVVSTFAPNASNASFTKTSTNTYDNDVSNWRLCRLRTATVESTQSAYSYGAPNIIGTTETRSSSFTYKAGTSLLETETVQEGGAQAITLTTQYFHDRFGNRIQANVSGWNGVSQATETRTSKTTYDDKGRFPIESENAAGHKEYPTHESVQGTLISLKGPNDLTTTFKYDRLGRKVTEIRPDLTKTAISYASLPAGGGRASTKITGGGETFAETDKLGREIRKGVKIADYGIERWSYITTVYDARGRVEKTSRPYFEGDSPIYPVSRKYDNLDRVEEETLRNDDSTTTVTKTDFSGLVTEVTVTATDANNQPSTRKSTSELDARGMTKKVTNTQDNTVEHMYDAAGNLVRTTRTVGAQKMVTAIEYDLRGRKTKLSDPDTGAYEYKYNAFGELIEQKDGNQVITYTKYDRLGRVTERASGGDLTSNYTYDACTKGKGKLCSVTAKGIMSPSNSSQTVGYTRTLTYDAYGRMETETSNIGARTFVASTTYDASGRVKKITYPNGQFVTRGYDSVGAWNRLLDNQGRELWKGGAADAEARWRSWTLGNGRITSTGFGANTGRLSSLATDGDVQSLALAYDGFGNIKTRLDALNNYRQSNGTAEAYRYDNLNQLIQADIFEGRQNISYDGFGRIVTKTGVNGVAGTYEYYALTTNDSNTSNRIQAANNRNYGYDDNGNVTSITGTAAGSITLSWTSFNQPMTLPVAASNSSVAGVLGNPNCNGQIVICFRYGADNERRIEFLPPDSNVLGGNQGTTRYHLHAGAALFYEEDVRADGTREQRAYFTGPLGVVALHTTNTDSAGNAVAPTGGNAHAQNNNGTPYTLTYWHRDHLGSLTVTTNDSGAVVQRMRFDPWGKPQTSLGSRARAGDRGFTGHEHLAGGLIHMNGRIYDPVLGRFLSADIVVQFPDAITSYNRYAYVMNNPLAYTDPSGYFLQFLPVIWAAIVKAAPFIAGAAAVAGAVALATGHTTAARRFFAVALTFTGIHFAAGAAAAGTAAGNVAAGAWTIGTAFAAGGVQSGSIEGAIFAAMTAGAGIISAEIVSGLVTGLVDGVNSAFNSASYSGTNGIQVATTGQADPVLTDIGYQRPTQHIKLVEVVGSRQEFYRFTVTSFAAAAILPDGTQRLDGVSITGRRYSPVTAAMTEWLSMGTPFGGLLSCSSQYEQCGGVGWGFAVLGVVPGGGSSSGVKPLALGVSQHLDAFATARGAVTWKSFADPTRWKQGVLDALADPKRMVHFNLDGVDVWKGVQRASSGRGGATDWELLQVKQNPQFWDTIKFWKDGQQVANPFK
jgi:RHS repeat-associated protein